MLPAVVRRISWGAVIAGTVVALVVHLMFSLLGLGIGATQVDPAAGAAAFTEGLGIGAAVWWILSVLISLFIGGWIAGYLSGIPEKRDGALHGIVTWGLAMLLGAWFATTAVGTIAAGAWNVLEGGMTMIGQQQQISPEAIAQIEDEELRQQIQQALPQEEDVQAVAEDVTEVVAQAGIWGFVGMLLAAVVAALGGLLGAVQTGGRTYPIYQRGERREEERGREREREYGPRERERERGRYYDYERERAEREGGEREGGERERAEREGGGRPGYSEREGMLGREEYEQRGEQRGEQPGEREREQQRERLERERAERERQQRDVP